MDVGKGTPLETALGAVEAHAAGLRKDTAAKYRRTCDRIESGIARRAAPS